jgi:RsiW-degrading membrane proteinase PrsW (M82 family)
VLIVADPACKRRSRSARAIDTEPVRFRAILPVVKALRSPRLDPLLFGSPMRRPLVAKVVIAFLAALLLIALAMALLTMSSMGRDGTTVFAKALVVSSALSLCPLAVLWWLDRRERESAWLFAVAFLWGGAIAAWLSMPLNTLILISIDQWVAQNPQVTAALGADATRMIGAPIAAPLVEETTKGLGIVLLFLLLHAEFDNMRDGLVYGGLVGAGFNWVESALYVAQGYVEFGDVPWGLQLGARYALFGLGGHVLFSGLFGAFLGLARQMRSAWRVLVPFAGLFLAIAAHAINNLLPLVGTLIQSAAGKPPPQTIEAPPAVGFVDAFFSASLLNLIVFLPFLLLIAWLLVKSGRWEREVIRNELAAEPVDIVTTEEMAAIERDGAFRTRRIDRLQRRQSAGLVRLQHELAFRKRRVRLRDRDPEADPLVARWRAAIRQLRAMFPGRDR